MDSSFIALAFFSGRLGQAFEYWPFTLLITVTLTYTAIAIGTDITSRRRKPPAGAAPRMEFMPNPGAFARGRFRTGLFLIRFGSTVTLVAVGLFCYVASFPLAIGINYGLPPDPNSATVTGTTISLIVAILVFLAAIYIRKLPVPLIAFILVGLVVAMIAPSVSNGQGRWLGIMSATLGIPLIMILIGSTLALRHYSDAKIAIAYPAPTAPHPPIGVG